MSLIGYNQQIFLRLLSVHEPRLSMPLDYFVCAGVVCVWCLYANSMLSDKIYILDCVQFFSSVMNGLRSIRLSYSTLSRMEAEKCCDDSFGFIFFLTSNMVECIQFSTDWVSGTTLQSASRWGSFRWRRFFLFFLDNLLLLPLSQLIVIISVFGAKKVSVTLLYA